MAKVSVDVNSAPIDLVTGATSRFGFLVVKKLVKAGHEVRIIIKDEPSRSEDWEKLPSGAKPYVADLTLKRDSDKENLKEACKGVDNIFHIAGAVYNYRHTYDEFININVIGTENLIDAALEANKNKSIRFICASSVTVYGYRRPGEILTEESETRPASNYSNSKLMEEEVIKAYEDAHPNFKYTILRYSTIYGPGYEGSFFKIFRLIKERKLRYIGNGNNNILLIHINDAVDAMIKVSETSKSINAIYNVSDGEEHTIRSLYEFVAKMLDVPPPDKKMPYTVARIGGKILGLKYDELEFLTSDRRISIEKIKKEVGFKPKINIEMGGGELIGEFIKSDKTKK